MLRSTLAVFAVLLSAVTFMPPGAHGQSKSDASKTASPATTPSAPPTARPADVTSSDAILAAIYDVISGPAAQKRDWDRFRSLFVPGARLIPTGPKRAESASTDKNAAPAAAPKEFGAFVMTPDEFADRGNAYFEKNSFYEREAARRAERYGNIMHVFSTYESRHDPKDAEPFARGINSFQLLFDGSRWWVVTIYWQQESSEAPLPKEFLPAAK